LTAALTERWFELLGFDDLIVGLEPMTERSLDRLAEAFRLRGR
jgi:hypothetical protein